jgi:putative oxidoreductase
MTSVAHRSVHRHAGDAHPAHPHRVLHAVLWIAQGGLAAVFGSAGFMKATMPLAALVREQPKMQWVLDVPAALVRFIGAAEIAGALGLVLPALFRVKPRLTPWAAMGLLAIMVLASAFHLLRGEPQALPVTAALGAVAAFVAWGRFRKEPIPERVRREA